MIFPKNMEGWKFLLCLFQTSPRKKYSIHFSNALKLISGNGKGLNSGHVVSAYVPWDKAAIDVSEEDYCIVTLPVERHLQISPYWCKLASAKGEGRSDCHESGINHTFMQNRWVQTSINIFPFSDIPSTLFVPHGLL